MRIGALLAVCLLLAGCAHAPAAPPSSAPTASAQPEPAPPSRPNAFDVPPAPTSTPYAKVVSSGYLGYRDVQFGRETERAYYRDPRDGRLYWLYVEHFEGGDAPVVRFVPAPAPAQRTPTRGGHP